jgi:hypothetical protein
MFKEKKQPKRIGALGEARAENARLKRQVEEANKLADAAEELLELWQVGEGWIVFRKPDGTDRTIFHGRARLPLLYALLRYRKITK